MRNLVDWDLAEVISRLVQRECNSREKPTGVAVATLCQVLVATCVDVADDDLPEAMKTETAKARLMSAIKFQIELHNEGFEVPGGHG